jgi:hypothetical protein
LLKPGGKGLSREVKKKFLGSFVENYILSYPFLSRKKSATSVFNWWLILGGRSLLCLAQRATFFRRTKLGVKWVKALRDKDFSGEQKGLKIIQLFARWIGSRLHSLMVLLRIGSFLDRHLLGA